MDEKFINNMRLSFNTLDKVKRRMRYLDNKIRTFNHSLRECKPMEVRVQGLVSTMQSLCDHKYYPEYKGVVNNKHELNAVGRHTSCCRICKQYIASVA